MRPSSLRELGLFLRRKGKMSRNVKINHRYYAEGYEECVSKNRTISNVPTRKFDINEKLENYGTFPDGTNYLFLLIMPPNRYGNYNSYNFVIDFTENFGIFSRIVSVIEPYSIFLSSRFYKIMHDLTCAFPFGNKIELYCREEPLPFWRNYYHISNYVLFTELSGWDGEEQLFLNKISGKITPDIFAENPGKREIFLNSVFSQICKIRPFLNRLANAADGILETVFPKIEKILEEYE